MKKLYLSVVCLFALGLIACNGGGSNTTAQNMPVGSPPFTGTFTPGIGNVTINGTSCNFTNSSEMLNFTVNESSPTIFDDNTFFSSDTVIFSGNFVNPVNQNTPCFQGNVTSSLCGNAQSGTIKFVGCSVYLSASSAYIFKAQYYLYSPAGTLLTVGTVNANK